MITVVCWLWNGWRNVYEPEHVYHLRRMLQKHCARKFRFVCVTDQPERLPGIETIKLWELNSPIPRIAGAPNCYKRLKLFSTEAREQFGDLVVSIDLDVLICGDVLSLVDDTSDFGIMKGYCNPYNGSFWQVRPGVNPQLWDDLNHDMAIRVDVTRWKAGKNLYGSDQAIMAMVLPGIKPWDESDGLYQFNQLRELKPPAGAKAIFFAGTIKPWSHGLFKNQYWRAGA